MRSLQESARPTLGNTLFYRHLRAHTSGPATSRLHQGGPDGAQERLGRKRLWQETDARLQDAVARYCVVRITRHVDDTGLRPVLNNPIADDPAAPARHDDVGQDEMNRLRVCRACLDGFLCRRRDQDVVAAFLEDALVQVAQTEVVFDHQDRFVAFECLRLVGSRMDRRGGCFVQCRWEIDLEGRAYFRLAVQKDVSTALADDAIDGRQAETGSQDRKSTR